MTKKSDREKLLDSIRMNLADIASMWAAVEDDIEDLIGLTTSGEEPRGKGDTE